MRAATLLVVALALFGAGASAQVARPPVLRVSSAQLQSTAEQRWDAVLAADQTFTRALHSAVSAEISARRARGEDVTELIAEQARLQDMQMSFNLQYLQLQNNMQNENRQFTMISNIMKTRHDTVRNSISNVR